MTYAEDDFLMISSIQHFIFCKRQWALIHLEQLWTENYHTILGEIMHENAHDPYLAEKRNDTIVRRALPVSSKRLGLSGECDVVEFQKSPDGIRLHGHRGTYSIYPVEYKKGKPKVGKEDVMQLVAQSLCLEEMFSARVSEGALFYGSTRRRERIAITDELRIEAEKVIAEMHQYFSRGYTPKVKTHRRCRGCSLIDLCMPELEKTSNVNKFIHDKLQEEVAS